MSSFFKSTPFGTGVGSVGAGGAGITVWQFYETENVGQLNPLNPSGLGVFGGSDGEVLEPDPYSHKITTSSCFENFFPGVGKVTFASGGSSNNVTPPTLSSKEKNDSKSILGCTLAQLAYLESSNSSVDAPAKFIFRSETAFKNDRTGGVVGSLWDGKITGQRATDGQQYLRYYVLFLESSNDLDGSIKGGYWGKDDLGSDPSRSNKIHVEVGGTVWMNQKTNFSSSSSSPSGIKKEYMGFWKEEDRGSAGLLNAMELRSLKDGNIKCEILCKQEQTFAESKKKDVSSPYENYFGSLYKGGDKKWIGETPKKENSSAVIANLDSWYDPFKGRKGKGNAMEKNFCSPNDDTARSVISDFEFKSLCYKK